MKNEDIDILRGLAKEVKEYPWIRCRINAGIYRENNFFYLSLLSFKVILYFCAYRTNLNSYFVQLN